MKKNFVANSFLAIWEICLYENNRTIIPTDLLQIRFYLLFCALLQNHVEFNKLLWRNFFTWYSYSNYSFIIKPTFKNTILLPTYFFGLCGTVGTGNSNFSIPDQYKKSLYFLNLVFSIGDLLQISLRPSLYIHFLFSPSSISQ